MIESIAPSSYNCYASERVSLFGPSFIFFIRANDAKLKNIQLCDVSYEFFSQTLCPSILSCAKITKSDSLDDDDWRLFWLLTLCSRISNIWPSKKRDERDHVGLSRERARAAMTKRRPPNSSQKDKSGESR